MPLQSTVEQFDRQQQRQQRARGHSNGERIQFGNGRGGVVEDVIETALHAAGLTVRQLRLPGWDRTFDALDPIILGELWMAHHALLDVEGVGPFVNDGLRAGTPRRTWHRLPTSLAVSGGTRVRLRRPAVPAQLRAGFPAGMAGDAAIVIGKRGRNGMERQSL